MLHIFVYISIILLDMVCCVKQYWTTIKSLAYPWGMSCDSVAFSAQLPCIAVPPESSSPWAAIAVRAELATTCCVRCRWACEAMDAERADLERQAIANSAMPVSVPVVPSRLGLLCCQALQSLGLLDGWEEEWLSQNATQASLRATPKAMPKARPKTRGIVTVSKHTTIQDSDAAQQECDHGGPHIHHEHRRKAHSEPHAREVSPAVRDPGLGHARQAKGDRPGKADVDIDNPMDLEQWKVDLTITSLRPMPPAVPPPPHLWRQAQSVDGPMPPAVPPPPHLWRQAQAADAEAREVRAEGRRLGWSTVAGDQGQAQ
jgi:hypothetical protein